MDYVVWLYLATRLDAIQTAFGFMIGIPTAFIVITGLCCAIGETTTPWKITKGHRIFASVLIVIGILGSMITPSKKDAMFIAGGVGVIEGAKALAGSEIAKTSVSIIEKWLKEQEAELDAKAAQRRK